jgi:protease I
MNRELENKKIAILATDGFEEAELFEPKNALEAAGADVDVVSLSLGQIKSWKDGDWGAGIMVDKELLEANFADYDALVLPGGVINADKLRNEESAIDFVRGFVQNSKPIAAICHAPWILIEAGLHDRTLTSWPSLKTDLRNAGLQWVDREVVVDEGLVTSRKPADLEAFTRKMVEEFQGGRQRPPRRKLFEAERDLLN